MENILEAKSKLLKKYPFLKVTKCILYKNLFVFIGYDKNIPGPYEQQMDPFYSVNKQTGEILNFSPSLYDEDLFFKSKVIEL